MIQKCVEFWVDAGIRLGFHPRPCDLMAFCERQLTGLRQRNIAAHLASCPRCRGRTSAIRESIAELTAFEARTAQPAAGDLMQGLDAVLGRVQEWKAVHAAGSESAIAEELGLFLGRHAGRFLNEEPSLPVLVERVHPALATLVGREAAEILEERVLRTADLRGAPGFSF